MERKLRRIRLVLMVVLYQYSYMVRSLPEELQFLLPQKVVPQRYEVTIEHNIDDQVPNYSGEVRIEVYCSTRTDVINFHLAGGVQIKTIKVKKLIDNNDSPFNIKDSNYFPGNQWEVILHKPLEEKNRYEIKIEFFSNFASTTGYIRKTYEKDENASQRVMTFTKLNEFDARKIIPCLDQINLKSKFKIWFIHPERFVGFSNAGLKAWKNIDGRPGWVKYEFHETDDMATFSIAMALLQEFETTGFHHPSKVNVQTWADKDVIEKMLYINELASKSFKFFSQLFNLAHPLKKLDILILPDVDFEVEESFGIVYISQKYVLDTLEKSSDPITYEMVSKICHAVSYQWIGNTVTMFEWKDTWFHQGLNYFLQKECAKKIFPEYSPSILELDMIESFLAFMRSEEIAEYDEPITILKSYPDLKFMKFVTIEKIYHLIRMMHFILEPDLFNESLERYVEEFRCHNSNLNESLDVFTRKANSVRPTIFPFYRFTMQSIIKSWLNQTGAPIIVVERHDATKKISLSQEIFNSLELDKDERNQPDNEKYWFIPLSCTTEQELKFDVVAPRAWLEELQHQWSPPEFEENGWILCNLEFNVPGRVLYDDNNWNKINKFFRQQDKFKQISVLTRARVISDMFTLAEAGVLMYEIVLDTMKYLHYEEDFVPWIVALKEFDRIRSRLLGSGLALFERYQKFVRGILEPMFQRRIKHFPTNPTENTMETQFYLLFMEISCKFDFEGCLEKSSELKKAWHRTSEQGKETTIRRRLYKVVLCEQIKNGNKDKWIAFWKSYYEEERRSSKEDLSQAFGCSQKTEDLQMLLEKSISDQRISREDSLIIFQSLTSNKKGYKLMKNFFKKFYKKINSFHSGDEQSMLAYLRILFDATNRRRDLNEIAQFAISKKVNMTDKLTNKSVDNARRNIFWVHRSKKVLENFLSDHKLKKLFDKLKNKFKFK